MKSKTRTILKTVLTLIGFCLLMGGCIGFMTSALFSVGKTEIGKYYEQHPLNDKTGIVVDSNGNIYIGEGQTGSIQVYDSLGIFQYGFSFPTGGAGWFDFGIQQDKIHIVTARTESYFIFDRGELVSSEEGIQNSRREELIKQYNMIQGTSYVTSNKSYKISSFNTVKIQDKESGQVEKMHLNAPIWPFPIAVFWGVAAAGMGLIFVLHRKFFISRFRGIRK